MSSPFTRFTRGGQPVTVATMRYVGEAKVSAAHVLLQERYEEK